jgi:hypothetical protein
MLFHHPKEHQFRASYNGRFVNAQCCWDSAITFVCSVAQMKRKQDGQAQDDSDSEDTPKPSAPKKAKTNKAQAKPSSKTNKKGDKFSFG